MSLDAEAPSFFLHLITVSEKSNTLMLAKLDKNIKLYPMQACVTG
jgi:hypothetical protein